MPADRLFFGGFQVRDTTSASMVRFLWRRIAANRKIAVGFANHHFITACQALEAHHRTRRDVVLLNDGIGIELAARLRFGRGFAENMNGTDFVPLFLSGSSRELTVYLIGSGSDVVRQAVDAIAALPNCEVVGFCDGFSLWQHETAVLAEIERLRPDVLLVGMGNPLQERWIAQNWDQLHARVIIGVGALFEWMTGTKRRAPHALRFVRLEWAYRLIIEPRRLLRRYTWEALQFFAIVFLRGPSRAERSGRG